MYESQRVRLNTTLYEISYHTYTLFLSSGSLINRNDEIKILFKNVSFILTSENNQFLQNKGRPSIDISSKKCLLISPSLGEGKELSKRFAEQSRRALKHKAVTFNKTHWTALRKNNLQSTL